MRIIIFDDSTKDTNDLLESIKYCLDYLKLDASFETYHDTNHDIDFKNYDLIFLDVELGNMNGIDFGEKIRKSNKDVPIILTTNYKQYAIDGYRSRAERYFLKPINKNELLIEMQSLLKNIILDSMFIYDNKLAFDKVYFKDIIFVEYLNRKSILHMKNNRCIESNKSLKDWQDIVNDYGFCLIHRSFLINLRQIKSINGNIITMNNNDKLELSRHYKDDFKIAFNDIVIRGF